jgi:hypothetical protein
LTIAGDRGALFTEDVALLVSGEVAAMSYVQCRNSTVNQGSQLTGVGNTIDVAVFPETELAERFIGAIDYAITVGVEGS